MSEVALSVALHKLRQRKTMEVESLINADAMDFPDYKYKCGVLRGLNDAVLTVENLLQESKQNDDENNPAPQDDARTLRRRS
ncbi:MAG: hypothetical protein V6Z86_05710 [Hyphomicrobiales bacterium]